VNHPDGIWLGDGSGVRYKMAIFYGNDRIRSLDSEEINESNSAVSNHMRVISRQQRERGRKRRTWAINHTQQPVIINGWRVVICGTPAPSPSHSRQEFCTVSPITWRTMYHGCRPYRRLSRPKQGARWICLAFMSTCAITSERSTVNPPSVPSRQFLSISPISPPSLSRLSSPSLFLVLDVRLLTLFQTSTCGSISNNTLPSAASTSVNSAALSSSPPLNLKRTSPQTAAAHDPGPNPPPPSTTQPPAPS